MGENFTSRHHLSSIDEPTAQTLVKCHSRIWPESDPFISQNILEQPSDENTAAICREQKVVCAQLKLKYVFPWVSMDRLWHKEPGVRWWLKLGQSFWVFSDYYKKLFCFVPFIWGAWGWGWGSSLCRNASHTSHTWTQAMVITLSIQRPARTCGQLCNQGIVLQRIYMAVWESSQKRHFTMQYLWVPQIHLPKHNWLGRGA